MVLLTLCTYVCMLLESIIKYVNNVNYMILYICLLCFEVKLIDNLIKINC